MLRAASFKLAPIAFRARNALANPLLPLSERRRFCSASAVGSRHNEFLIREARSTLLNAFEYEIKFNELLPLRPAVPADLPFDFEHNRHDEVSLTREIDGEKIEISVFNNLEEDDENQNAAADSDSDEKSPARSVPVKVRITKSNGKSMKFAARISSDGVVIRRLTTRDGDNKLICSQLYIEPESELQMSLRELLKTKGIGKSMGEFVYDYMSWKSKIPNYLHYPKPMVACSAEKCEQNVEILKKLKKVVVDEWVMY